MSTDLFDEDDYVRPLLESLTPTLRRSLHSGLATPKTEAGFFVSHRLRYRRKPEEWARVVEILRIYPNDRQRLVGIIDRIEAES